MTSHPFALSLREFRYPKSQISQLLGSKIDENYLITLTPFYNKRRVSSINGKIFNWSLKQRNEIVKV